MPLNPHRIKLAKFLEQEGYESFEEYSAANQSMLMDSIVPALCTEYCEVEPDGRCEHDCPSILLAIGMI